MKKHSVVKHEILNLLSIIQIHLLEGDLDPQVRRQLVSLLRIASLLTNHEQLYDGIAPELFHQKISLYHIIDDLQRRQPDSFRAQNTELPAFTEYLSLDRYFFTEALQILITQLSLNGKPVTWQWDATEQTLLLLHEEPLAPIEQELARFLSKNKPSLTEIGLPLSLFLLTTHQITPRQDQRSLRIPLKHLMDHPSHTHVHAPSESADRNSRH